MPKIKNIIACLMLIAALTPCFAAQSAKPASVPVHPAVVINKNGQISVKPLDLVASPERFLNKKIVMDGKFDKFTTLGLDYKKAFRDSGEYIGFLIQRDDVKDHNIPLSELKLFMKRDYAEKFIDLNTGDKISISGVVFSNALGDGWVDVNTLEILEKAKEVKDLK